MSVSNSNLFINVHTDGAVKLYNSATSSYSLQLPLKGNVSLKLIIKIEKMVTELAFQLDTSRTRSHGDPRTDAYQHYIKLVTNQATIESIILPPGSKIRTAVDNELNIEVPVNSHADQQP